MALKLGDNPYLVLISWLVLYSLAQIGLVAILATILLPIGKRRGVRRRQPTLVNMLVITLVTTVVNALLFYSGDMLNPNVPLPICLVQMVLKRGTVAMFVTAILSVTVEAWRGVQLALKNSHENRQLETIILLILPWAAFCIFSLIFAIRGFQQPEEIHRIDHLYYCSFRDNTLGYVVSGYLALAVLASLFFAIWTTVSIVHIARSVRTSRRVTLERLNISCLIRIGIVIVILFITFVMNIVQSILRDVMDTWILTFVEASTPLLIVFIFGLQTDILRAWACWRRNPLIDEEWGTIHSKEEDTLNLKRSSSSLS